MFKMFLVFATVFLVVWCSINGFRALNGYDRWELTKVAAYSLLCSALATGFLITIVILF